MKIKIKNTNSVADSVKVSECFWYKGLLYMRVALGIQGVELDENKFIYAVVLSTGSVHWLSKDVQVETVDCSVVSSVSSLDIPGEKDKWEV